MKRVVANDARTTRIVVHRKLLGLINDFLAFKREYGTDIEKQIYGQGDSKMTTQDFIKRLISKRPMYFFTSIDRTMLRDGSPPSSENWLKVGTPEEEQIYMKD